MQCGGGKKRDVDCMRTQTLCVRIQVNVSCAMRVNVILSTIRNNCACARAYVCVCVCACACMSTSLSMCVYMRVSIILSILNNCVYAVCGEERESVCVCIRVDVLCPPFVGG